ncbi:hypothetical protein PDJAM_G00188440 [Pangasius djambal]|uniref:Uncharacterized protein n=1 Tax=Pangasius djambal TaxID=1691987 RepID=A0ACC5Y519_9TELE|nr:hypothetical protein [Pangasius djambal]
MIIQVGETSLVLLGYSYDSFHPSNFHNYASCHGFSPCIKVLTVILFVFCPGPVTAPALSLICWLIVFTRLMLVLDSFVFFLPSKSLFVVKYHALI